VLINPQPAHVQVDVGQQHRGRVHRSLHRPLRHPKVFGDLPDRPTGSRSPPPAARLQPTRKRRARIDNWSAVEVKVRRGHAGSPHTSRGLRTITARWLACAMSHAWVVQRVRGSPDVVATG
jgi:hypothetical protein